jgi:predicted nucleic-acid-binding protein
LLGLRVAAVDTNVLVRLLVADDAKQFTLAQQALRDHGPVFVTQIALIETVWVLAHTYKIARRDLEEIIEQLLLGAEFVLQGAEQVAAALATFRRSRADFADCLLLENALSAGQLPLLTFDKVLGRLQGGQVLARNH